MSALNPLFPDAIVCYHELLEINEHAILFNVYDDGSVSYTNGLLFDSAGEWVSGGEGSTCETKSLATLGVDLQTREFGYATSTTQILTLDHATVDVPNLTLALGFLMFFMTAAAVISFFKKR